MKRVLPACAGFVLLGCLFIPYNEALFAAPLDRGVPRDYPIFTLYRFAC